MTTRYLMILALALSLGSALHAVTFTLVGSSGWPGSTATMEIWMTAGVGELPASLNFDLTFPSSQFSGGVGVNWANGPTLIAAGKSSVPANPSPGLIRMVIYGLNSNVVANGHLGTVTFQVPAAAALGPVSFGMTNIVVGDASATTLLGPHNVVPGSITIETGPPSYIGPNSITVAGTSTPFPVPLALGTDPSVSVSTLSFTVMYSSSMLNYVSASADPSVTAAGKSLNASLTSPGNLLIMITGAQSTAIPNGVICQVTFTLSASAGPGSVSQVTCTNMTATNPSAGPVTNLYSDSADIIAPSATLGLPTTPPIVRSGDYVRVPLVFNNLNTTTPVTDIVFDVRFDYATAAATSLALAAGKQVLTSSVYYDSYSWTRVWVYGATLSPMPSGEVVELEFWTQGQPGQLDVVLSNFTAYDSSATPINGAVSTNGQLTVIPWNPVDVNRDDVVNVTDVQLTINRALGIYNSYISAFPDVNGDNVVNVIDVQLIIHAILNPQAP